jgi:hypothetical protein
MPDTYIGGKTASSKDVLGKLDIHMYKTDL